MKNFFKNINRVLTSGLFVIVGLFISVLCWMFTPWQLIPMWVVAISLLFSLIVWILTYTICSNYKSETDFKLPGIKGISVKKQIVFLLEYNEIYSIDSLVSIYYQDDDTETEILIGIGYVETKTEKGNLQINFCLPIEEDSFEIINTIKNDSKTKRCIKIKPSIPKKYLGGM